MRIRKLKLFTNKLELEKNFYAEILGFEVIENKPNLFTIKVGWSELTFEASKREHKYHYCFLIPANKLSEAMNWMEKRIPIIDLGKGSKTQRFESWDADSFYFYDGSGNIAEFIVRHELNNFSDTDFNISNVLCVNEIGMPTKDVAETNSILQEKYGTEFWKGDPKRFGTNGDQEGLFLLPNYEIKEIWFPTSLKIKPEPFEIIFDHKEERYSMEFSDGEIKTTANRMK
ncbi:MAG: VOC family protein [Saprospiraceae bacterium]